MLAVPARLLASRRLLADDRAMAILPLLPLRCQKRWRKFVYDWKLKSISSRWRPSRLRDAVPLRAGKPRKEDPLDVMIHSLCPVNGEGILRLRWKTHANFIVDRQWLVTRGLPGELVTIKFDIVKQKPYPRGDLEVRFDPNVTKVFSSPYEVRPLCPHYDYCGGCDFLNLRYGRQLIEKQRWLEHAFSAAKLPLATLHRMRPSEPQARYAHRTEWLFREQEHGDIYLGPPGEGPEEVPTGEPPASCALPPRVVVRTMTSLYHVFREVREESDFGRLYTIYEEKRGLGLFKGIVAVCSRVPPWRLWQAGERSTGDENGLGGGSTELLLSVVLADDSVRHVSAMLEPLVEAAKEAAGPRRLVGIVADFARSKRQELGGRKEVLLYGRRYVRQDFAVNVQGQTRHFELRLGAGSRLLAHTRQLPEVAETVVDMCRLGETDVVWHCFCGSGELSLALGAACIHVVAVGGTATEVSELKRNLAANKVGNTTAVLTNLHRPWALKQLSYHISQSQQRRLLLGTGEEQAKAREYAITAFVPGESRRRVMQRLTATPFTAPLLRQDAMAHRELQVLLPAFVRDFRPSRSTALVPQASPQEQDGERGREVPPEMETRLKRLYRRLALKYHPDKNPDDPEAVERFLALTRAYKALAGDTAGPEPDDEEARDPFDLAHQLTYRGHRKQKNRWRGEGGELRRRPRRSELAEAAEEAKAALADGEEQPALEMEDEEQQRVRRNVEAAFGADPGDGSEGGQPPAEEEEESDWELDPSVVTKLEIDDSWAQGPIPDAFAAPEEAVDADGRRIGERDRPSPDVVLRDDGPGDLAIDPALGEVPMPTLQPPDVIVVAQPQDRKPGRGTSRHFHSWLRSTAARAIVYVARDVEAFTADVKGLQCLGYRLTDVRPFDPEPHRRPILLVARLELVRPLAGSQEYERDGARLIPGAPPMLPGTGDGPPLLGSGGYLPLPGQ